MVRQVIQIWHFHRRIRSSNQDQLDKETVECKLGKTSEMIRKMAHPSVVQRLSSSKFPHEQHSTKELREMSALATTKFHGFNDFSK